MFPDQLYYGLEHLQKRPLLYMAAKDVELIEQCPASF